MVPPDVFNSNPFPLHPMRLSRDVFIQTMTLANRFAMETVYSKRKSFPMKTRVSIGPIQVSLSLLHSACF